MITNQALSKILTNRKLIKFNVNTKEGCIDITFDKGYVLSIFTDCEEAILLDIYETNE